MSIIWLESFDFYGTDMANLSQRGYLVDGIRANRFDLIDNNSVSRTGNGCLQFNSVESNRYILKVIDTADLSDTVGSGVGFYVSNAFDDNVNNPGLSFGSSVNNGAFRITYSGVNNSISLWSGTSKIASSPTNIINQNVWYWLEVKIQNNTINGGANTGRVEVKVNGVTVIIATGLNINYQIINVGLGQAGVGGSGIWLVRFDDWIVWNGEGTVNNDFLGDRRVTTLYPNADTVINNWTPSIGTDGFALIDENNPNDTTFVTANNAGDVSEYEKQAISIDTNDIAAVAVVSRIFKDNAGSSTARIGVNSNSFISNGPIINPSVSPSYFTHIVELNPNGNVPWTRSAVDNAFIRLTREA